MEEKSPPLSSPSSHREELSPQELKKPSLLSQLLPYLIAAAILIYVFRGLSSSVVENHHLEETKWSELGRGGVKASTVKISDPAHQLTYCPAEEKEKEEKSRGPTGCPPGGDFEVRPETAEMPAAVRRTLGSRIPDGAEVQVEYVKRVRPAEIWAMMRQVDFRWYLPFMFLHIIVFSLGDVFSFGQAYRFFNLPQLRLREMMEVRLAPYVIQIGLAPLAEVFFPLYLWRVKRAPVSHILSSNLWTMILDVAAVMTMITAAVLYNLHAPLIPAIGLPWLAGCGLFWVVFLGSALILHQKRLRAWLLPRLESPAADKSEKEDHSRLAQSLFGPARLLRTFLLSRWHHVLRIYLVRLALSSSSVLSNYAVLRSVDVVPSLPVAMICFPIIVMSVFMPIGVGGYGGPQLIAWFLLVNLAQVGTADQVLAYSFLWSTGFLLGRAVVGLIFIRGFWQRCFPHGFRI